MNKTAKPTRSLAASLCAASLAAVLLLPAVAHANGALEQARDLMEANKFEEARKLMLPLARSGNADAEELIGVMYALGLGVEKDDRRAFEWYLRSSLKGHPGAQSGLAWYYEVGRGLPAPDKVRAHMWYTLSSIGGDVDAPDSLASIEQRMTRAEINESLELVADYKPWLYPFR